MNETGWPAPGSAAEIAAWRKLQQRVPDLYRRLSTFPRTPQTVVVVPSLSLSSRELSKIAGVWHYEERMLVNLMLLRQPRTKVVVVTSTPIDPVIVDYYLAMLPGVPASHARRRLVLLHCADSRPTPLSQKILDRPRLLRQIRGEIDDYASAHLVCFNSSPLERTLAVRLGLPLHSVDPALNDLGSKSGCREVFRDAGILHPLGYERLSTPEEVAAALAEVKKQRPHAARAVIKLNEGFSGEGNAVFTYGDLDARLPTDRLARAILDHLPTQVRFEASSETWDGFAATLRDMQGVVEEWIEGDEKCSPSVQCRVNAVGLPQVISTHDQVLGGPTGQLFLGCRFPASPDYRLDVQRSGAEVASVLAERGVIGRFAVDFVSVRTPTGWQHHAIEINLRKGGTTHPFLTLKFLTDGTYDPEDGLFYSPSGRPKYYFASDTLQSERYVGLRPEDLIDIAVYHGLHFHPASERGVVFHLIGALSQFGKLGVVAIGDDPAQVNALYRRTLEVLDQETGPSAATGG